VTWGGGPIGTVWAWGYDAFADRVRPPPSRLCHLFFTPFCVTQRRFSPGDSFPCPALVPGAAHHRGSPLMCGLLAILTILKFGITSLPVLEQSQGFSPWDSDCVCCSLDGNPCGPVVCDDLGLQSCSKWNRKSSTTCRGRCVAPFRPHGTVLCHQLQARRCCRTFFYPSPAGRRVRTSVHCVLACHGLGMATVVRIVDPAQRTQPFRGFIGNAIRGRGGIAPF